MSRETEISRKSEEAMLVQLRQGQVDVISQII
jgi:hypothetical protein